MTLSQIQQVLSKANLKESFFGHKYGENHANRLNSFRANVNVLSTLPIFPAQMASLRESVLYNSTGDSLVHKNDELYHFFTVAEVVRLGSLALLEVINQLIGDEDENTIAIKLPDSADIQEITKFLSDIHTAIAQNIVNEEIGGRLELKSWQPGSLWIAITVGSVVAVKLVMGIVWAAAVIRKKQQEARILEKLADSMEVKNHTLEDLRKGAEEHIRLLIESEAKNLAAHHFKKGDNHEQIERLKLGIRTFTALIEKGAEIHPSLKAPESVKNLFPDFTKLDVIESKTKLISEHSQSKAN